MLTFLIYKNNSEINKEFHNPLSKTLGAIFQNSDFWGGFRKVMVYISFNIPGQTQGNM